MVLGGPWLHVLVGLGGRTKWGIAQSLVLPLVSGKSDGFEGKAWPARGTPWPLP